MLTDTRGPYTAAIFADDSTSVEGNGIDISSSGDNGATSSILAGAIELNGAGQAATDGHALTMVDGAIGAGVTGVSITAAMEVRSRRPSRTAGIWPGGLAPSAPRRPRSRADAQPADNLPDGPQQPTRPCPAGAQWASGDGFASARGE